jgi:hypothetical protein
LNLVVAAIVLWNTVYLERATWPEAPTPAPAPSPVAADTKKAKKGIK